MKILLVVNPISGGVNKEPFLNSARAICKKYGIDYEVFKTTGENDLENLQLILPKIKPDKVLSVGGDDVAVSCIYSD